MSVEDLVEEQKLKLREDSSPDPLLVLQVLNGGEVMPMDFDA